MFKKGMKGVLVRRWNAVGDFYAVEAEVFACGKKRMVLNRVDNGECLGREFLPQAKQYGAGVFLAGVDKVGAEAEGLAMAKAWQAAEIARGRDAIVKVEAAGHGDNGRYRAAVEKGLAAIEANAEPKVLWK